MILSRSMDTTSLTPGNSIWAPGCFILGCDLYFLLGQDNNTTPGTLVTNTYTYKAK